MHLLLELWVIQLRLNTPKHSLDVLEKLLRICMRWLYLVRVQFC